MGRVASQRAALHTRFPNNLGRLRVARGDTQKVIAEGIGVSRGDYALWESGVMLPSRGSLARLEETFEQPYPAWVVRVIEQAGGRRA